MKNLKIFFALLALVSMTGSLSAQVETWDIFDKSVWDEVNNNTSVNYQWGTVPVDKPNGIVEAFKKFITQYPDFVRLRKLRHASDGTFYISPNVNNAADGIFHNAIKTNTTSTSYTIELKIQVKDVADLISDNEFVTVSGGQSTGFVLANEIRPQFFGLKADFWIIYDAGGDAQNPWGISKTNASSGIEKRYPESFADTPHVYTVVYANPSTASPYFVSVDGEVVFSKNSSGTFNASGNNILVIGASSQNLCNMDVYYVKMKTTAAEDWNILDKKMDGMAIAKGSVGSASVTKATDAEVDYMNIKKEGEVADNGTHFYLTTTSSSPRTNNVYYNQIGAATLEENTAYTIEVKARIPSESTDDGNIIQVRLFNKIMGIVLSDGQVAKGAKHATKAGLVAGEDPISLTTSNWNTYALVMSDNQASYSVYVNSEIVFDDLPTFDYAPGDNYIRLGAESWDKCDMDVASVKMGTGDLISEEDTPTSLVAPVSDSNNVSVYPSIAEKGEQLTVNVTDADGFSVEITGMTGNRISYAAIAGSSGKIQAPIVPGVYFVKANQAGIAKIIVK